MAPALPSPGEIHRRELSASKPGCEIEYLRLPIYEQRDLRRLSKMRNNAHYGVARLHWLFEDWAFCNDRGSLAARLLQ
jgi:hypothetical protein